MANNIHDEFENEPDLAADFESEQDYVAPSLPEKVATGLAQRAEAITPSVEGTGEFLQPLAESALDFSRGVGSGLTFGAVDELGGALSAGAEALYNKFNPTDVALREQGFQIAQPDAEELYRQNQQAIQKEMEMSADRSPVLNIAGQIAGGVTSGSVIPGLAGIGAAPKGAKTLAAIMKDEGKLKALATMGLRGAKAYGKALPLIAAEGALSSKEGGLLNEQERSALAEDVTGSALFGIPAMLGIHGAAEVVGPAVGKVGKKVADSVKNKVEDSPILRQMRASYDYGLEGINPRSSKTQLATELGKTNLAELDNTRVQNLLKEINNSDQQIGKAVGDSLVNATNSGKIVDLSGDVSQSIGQLQNISAKYPELADNSRAQQIFSKIAENRGQVTPIEANDLIKYVDAYIGKFKTATNKTPLDQSILETLFNTRKDLSNTLKGSVPEYARAAERLASFRTLVPETIIARSRPVEVTDTYYSDLKNQEQPMFDALKAMLQGTTKGGSASGESRTAFVQSMKGMKQFEADEAARLAAGEIGESAMKRPVQEIEEEIKRFSDDAVARGAMDALSPQAGVSNLSKEAVLGYGAETGRSMALAASNKAGLIKKAINEAKQTNPVAKLGRGLINAPDELAATFAQKLENTQGLEKYGKQLTDAINTGDKNRKNKVLFTIMQNPAARAVVGNDQEEEP